METQELNNNDILALIARRDRRVDGRFYFGVKTTKIYCRPICPAKPKPENITLFRSSSEAELQGFRPCLRCRPDLAPGTKLLDGTMNTVARGLRLIHEGTDWDVVSLAATLGVSDRHLRRLFEQHLGASPIDIMLTRRLHFAKQLLEETAFPVTEVALASGFGSIRRFNEAFKARFHLAPSAVRSGRSCSDRLILNLAIRPPYDWDTVLAYLKRHETFGVERIEAGTYRRFLPRGDSWASLSVEPDTKQKCLKVSFDGLPLNELRANLSRLRFLFDIDHNPSDLPVTASLDPRGIRVPASFDPFETAISILLSQLVSTESAKNRLKKVVERYGRKLGEVDGGPVYAFPLAEVLAEAPVHEIGLTRTLSGAITGLSRALAEGSLDFRSHRDFAETTDQLLAIKGIGPWTAAMIAMRCLGNPDAFPALDLIVKRAIDQKIVDPRAWSSSRAYLTHCLWRDHGSSLSKLGQRTSKSKKEVSL